MSAGPRPIGPSGVWTTMRSSLRRYGHDRQGTSTSDEARPEQQQPRPQAIPCAGAAETVSASATTT
jgi:hypothetical protein